MAFRYLSSEPKPLLAISRSSKQIADILEFICQIMEQARHKCEAAFVRFFSASGMTPIKTDYITLNLHNLRDLIEQL